MLRRKGKKKKFVQNLERTMSVLSVLAVATATGAFTFSGPPPRAQVSAENNAVRLTLDTATSQELLKVNRSSTAR